MTFNVQQTISTLQNDTNRVQFENGQRNLGNGRLDRNAFLQLLMTQLQHQDPLEPVDNTEFIAQQAQFTQIERLDELNDTLRDSNQISQASAIVGKWVALQTTDQNNQPINLVGYVDSVTFDGTNGVGLNVGGYTYPMTSILDIYAGDPTQALGGGG